MNIRKNTPMLIVALCIITSCQKESTTESSTIKQANFVATTESYGNKTKTSLDIDGNILWSHNDNISIFEGSTINEQYLISEASIGKTYATLNKVKSDSYVTGTEIPANVAYYPYNTPTTIKKRDQGYSLTISLPKVQEYAINSFGQRCFPMLAITSSTEDKNLKFKNILGGIKLQLKGESIISKIIVSGNNKEPLCGDAEVYGSSNNTPTISMSKDAQEFITLDCGDGIQLNSETPTAFVIAIPPVTMTKGFNVTIIDKEGRTQTIKTTKCQTILRSCLLKMGVLNIDATNLVADLSIKETANCYIVGTAGDYKFKAVKGNSQEPIEDIKGVKLLWESFGTDKTPEIGDIINPTVKYSDGYIYFSTNNIYKEGNAVIAAYSDEACSDGNVIWSWHLWVTAADLENLSQTYHNNVGIMMDRNLGAINNDTNKSFGNVGLLYQWGRKDPFLGGYGYNGLDSWHEAKSTYSWPKPVGSNDTYGTIIYSVNNPSTFITGNNQNYDWLYTGDDTTDNSRWAAEKTIYDPCPPGYKIPNEYTWMVACGDNDVLYGFYSPYLGVTFKSNLSNGNVFYPYSCPRYYESGNYNNRLSGTTGAYWSVGETRSYDYHAPTMLMTSNDRRVYPHMAGFGMIPSMNYRSTANMIRCVKSSQRDIILPKSVTLDMASITMEPGDSKRIYASVLPENANILTTRYTSQNKNIATVSKEGLITGLKIGKTTIYAGSSLWQSGQLSYYNGTAKCEVLVCPHAPAGRRLDGRPVNAGWYIEAKEGDKISFEYEVGDGESGENYFTISTEDNIVHKEYGANFYGNFNYTFNKPFTGWLCMGWGWDLKLNNIEMTPKIYGYYSSGEAFIRDSWTSPPKYIFTYENGTLSMID